LLKVKSRRPFLARISAALTLFLVIGAILLPRFFRKPLPPREVPVSELTLREGRSYWKDDTTPFTGIITETYQGGGPKSRSVLSNGLMHGVSEGWHTNGVLQVREHFVEGISHGLREKWFPSGAKISEANIKSGKLDGRFRSWHENGSPAEEITMKDGQPDGLSMAYHPDGSLKAKATLQDGKVIEQQFWKPGELNGALTSNVNSHGR
jgi:antitoxin component YwqK of YwqJK toxin-antitoxin module